MEEDRGGVVGDACLPVPIWSIAIKITLIIATIFHIIKIVIMVMVIRTGLRGQFNIFTSDMIIIDITLVHALLCNCHHPTHTQICIIPVVKKWWRNVATLWHFALLPLLLRKVAATHHFVVVTLCLHCTEVNTFLHCTFTYAHACAHCSQMCTFLHKCAHSLICTYILHTAHRSAHWMESSTLHTMNLPHITLHFKHLLLWRVFSRRGRRIIRCTSHSEDMNTVVFECHAQHISGSFAWFHNNAISSMTLASFFSGFCTALQTSVALPSQSGRSAHCCFLHVSASCLLSGALTGIGSCLAPTCYTSNLAELFLYWQLLQNWHLLTGTCVNPTKVHTHSWSALPAVSQIYPGAINSTCVHKNLTISTLVFECIHTCPRCSAWRLNFCWIFMLNFWIMFAD